MGLVGVIFLSMWLWESEARAIVDRKGGQLDDTVEKLKERISFGSIYDLFDEVQELKLEVQRLRKRNEELE